MVFFYPSKYLCPYYTAREVATQKNLLTDNHQKGTKCALFAQEITAFLGIIGVYDEGVQIFKRKIDSVPREQYNSSNVAQSRVEARL
jgi:hypothetical protein